MSSADKSIGLVEEPNRGRISNVSRQGCQLANSRIDDAQWSSLHLRTKIKHGRQVALLV